MSQIQDPNKLYSFLRYYVDATFDLGYRKIEYHGLEMLPTDGAIIYAPNHTNGLMDALSVLVVQHSPTVFVARADIFKKPLLAKILRFLKIMPIMRIRDGYENLQRNDAIMKEAVSVLESKVPFCILPEGTHRTMHSLLPLLKGIFRIAIMANNGLKGKMPVYIVPMGIEYGDFFRYRSTLLLQIGNPINVTEFINAHKNLEQPELINAMRNELSAAMKQLIFVLPDDAYYNARYDICMMCKGYFIDGNINKRERLLNELHVKQNLAAKLKEYESKFPIESIQLLEQVNTFHTLRSQLNIPEELLDHSTKNIWVLIFRSFLLLLGLPYFIYCAIVTAPITLLTEWLKPKLDDPAFNNSIRYVLVLILLPIIWLILSIILFTTMNWTYALALLVAAIPAHIYFHGYYRKARIERGLWNWIRHPKLAKMKANIMKQCKVIFEIK